MPRTTKLTLARRRNITNANKTNTKHQDPPQTDRPYFGHSTPSHDFPISPSINNFVPQSTSPIHADCISNDSTPLHYVLRTSMHTPNQYLNSPVRLRSKRKLIFSEELKTAPVTYKLKICPKSLTPELKVRRSTLSKLKTYGRYRYLHQQRSTPISPILHQHPIGRRFVSVQSLETGLNLACMHSKICNNPQLYISTESRAGLKSNFVVKCMNCDDNFSYQTDEGPNTLPINEGAAWAGNATGIGFTGLLHSFTTLDIPFMNWKTYDRMQKLYEKDLKIAWNKLLIKNGEEEKASAQGLGQLDKDGIPWIDVIGDGQWSKRSYGQKGTALSGSAVLIGLLSKKPLFVGVRNSFCKICLENKNTYHKCYKNWEGTPSAMEADIVFKGFRKSLSVHGLRYKRYIGDGDSSVFKAIAAVYHTQEYFQDVQKIECANHAYRRMKKNLLALSTNTAFKDSCFVRKKLGENTDAIRKSCRHVTQLHIQNRPNTNADTLKADISAVPHHVFGNHDHCSVYIRKDGNLLTPTKYTKEKTCNDKESTQPTKNISRCSIQNYELMSTSVIWFDILKTVDRLASHSSSLLYDMTSNIAESFQSQINKFAQGRRINLIQRGSYKRIVRTATMAFQLGPAHYASTLEMSRGVRPSKLWTERENREAFLKETRLTRLSSGSTRNYRSKVTSGKSKLPEFFSRTRPMLGDPDYGENVNALDRTENELTTRLSENVTQKSLANEGDQWKIHIETRDQFANPMYVIRRQGMITASIAGTICKLKDSTSNVNVLDQLISPKCINNLLPIKWGKQHEDKARHLYETEEQVTVEKAGLFVSLEYGVLGASPDGLIGQDGILEIKCPYSNRHMSPSQAILSNYPLSRVGSTSPPIYRLAKTHDYYYQIVMQLHICNRKWCDFVVWTQGELNPETYEPRDVNGLFIKTRIYKDDDTLKRWTVMKNLLTRFFNEDFGPELVDSRYERNQGYRQPDYRLLAMETLTKTKEVKYLESRKLQECSLPKKRQNCNRNISVVKRRKTAITIPPNRVGILNIGNSCYRNVVFQMFREIREIFDCINPKIPFHDVLIRHLQATHEFVDDVTLTSMKKALDVHIPSRFSGFLQQDALEFIMTIMDKLEHHSVIRNFFETTSRERMDCSCGYTFSTEQESNIGMSVPLLRGNLQYNLNNSLLEKPIKDYLCSNCQQFGSVKTRTVLTELPKYLLVIVLRYATPPQKNLKKLDTPQTLTIPLGNDLIEYRLKGLINHIGEQIDCGHYIYGSTNDGKSFIVFDDDAITNCRTMKGSSYIYLFEKN